MITGKIKYSLVKIIIEDILNYGKPLLVLIFIIMISALTTIIITYKTRLLIFEHEQLLIEQNLLETEWQMLIFKKEKLIDINRIKNFAIEKLQMKCIDFSEEKFLVQS